MLLVFIYAVSHFKIADDPFLSQWISYFRAIAPMSNEHTVFDNYSRFKAHLNTYCYLPSLFRSDKTLPGDTDSNYTAYVCLKMTYSERKTITNIKPIISCVGRSFSLYDCANVVHVQSVSLAWWANVVQWNEAKIQLQISNSSWVQSSRVLRPWIYELGQGLSFVQLKTRSHHSWVSWAEASVNQRNIRLTAVFLACWSDVKAYTRLPVVADNHSNIILNHKEDFFFL